MELVTPGPLSGLTRDGYNGFTTAGASADQRPKVRGGLIRNAERSAPVPGFKPEGKEDLKMTNRAPDDLIPSLAHEDPLVRSYTARLLGLDAEAGGVEQYLKSVLLQETAPLRRVAAQAMGELAADWALEPLIAALGDADPAVRGEAARALGRLSNGAAVPELIALLSDPVPRVRAEALGTLAALEDARTVPHLTQAMQFPDVATRRKVASALLAMDARASAPAMVQALADPDSGIQDIAAEALGRWRVGEATEALVQALPRAPEATQVAICRALGQLQDAAAAPALIELLDGWRTRVNSKLDLTQV